ncbi:hypothetical protein MJO29_005454 [Puccinia striiformis f. sp. tritici]|nr:hypothetical protein MJO29_005454 [Puccinia striiformis f. sp. tritici]
MKFSITPWAVALSAFGKYARNSARSDRQVCFYATFTWQQPKQHCHHLPVDDPQFSNRNEVDQPETSQEFVDEFQVVMRDAF